MLINKQRRNLMMKDDIFRKKSLDKVNSPERLNDYVKVASPALWMLLIGILLLCAGAIVWACTYKLEINSVAAAMVEDSKVTLQLKNSENFKKVKVGTKIKIENKECVVEFINIEKYTFYSTISLENGEYNASVYIETTPIKYLIN